MISTPGYQPNDFIIETSTNYVCVFLNVQASPTMVSPIFILYNQNLNLVADFAYTVTGTFATAPELMIEVYLEEYIVVAMLYQDKVYMM